jgi:hypothetical protein
MIDPAGPAATAGRRHSAHPEMVGCARVQGGRRIRTGDIYGIFRGFESAAQHRNRVQDAVSGSSSAHSEMVACARVQGGRWIRTGDIYGIFRGFESAAQHRNRVQDAVSGWALENSPCPRNGKQGESSRRLQCIGQRQRYAIGCTPPMYRPDGNNPDDRSPSPGSSMAARGPSCWCCPSRCPGPGWGPDRIFPANRSRSGPGGPC